METEVIMKRELFGQEISQKSKSEFFSATDLVKAGNKWRLSNGYQPFDFTIWYRQSNTQEFVKELESKYGIVKITARGRGVHTWVHPYLFIDLALAISPNLKIEVYSWLHDYLIKYRNDSGDSYKKMTGALYLTTSNKSVFKNEISEIANKIKLECNVSDWNTANEKQLKLRDKIHEYIGLLSDIIRDREQLFNLAINKAKKEIGDLYGTKQNQQA